MMRERKTETAVSARLDLSGPILRTLASHPKFIEAKTVLLYHSLPDEVDTRDFIRYWATRKRILLPVVEGDELVLKVFHTDTPLNEGAFGILEPQGDNYTDFLSIDLAIIPGVAFDNKCNRLGRGKGYYDRLLKRMPHEKIYKIGLCFDFQKVEKIPCEPHDIAMDEVI